MKYSPEKISQVHVNVMELLVEKEIEKQLKSYPQNLRLYLNKIEIATYALNRLPPLYASSQIGREQQKQLGQKKHKEEIACAVRRAFAAVQRDPLRQSTPITLESEAQFQQASTALENLQNLLHEYYLLPDRQQLSWDNLTRIIQHSLNRMAQLGYQSTEPPSLGLSHSQKNNNSLNSSHHIHWI